MIEVLVKPGDTVARRAEPDHGRERQGIDGDPVEHGRRGQGAQGQGRRQGLAGQRRRDRRSKAGAVAAGAATAPAGRVGAAGRSRAGAGALRRARRHPPSGTCRRRRCRRTSRPRRPGALPHASPAIRKLARELGVPLDEVKGSGPKGRITQEDVQAFVKAVLAGQTQTRAQAGAGRRRGAGGGRRDARPAAVAAGRLRQVRADRAEGPVAHQAHQRPGAASQLGDDPARHQSRRRRHHRPRGVPRLDQQGEREERRQGDDARVPDQGLGRGAEEVPRVQRQPRRRADRPQAVLPHRLRRRHAERPGRPGDQGRRQEGRDPDLAPRWASSPRRRATASSRRAT